MFKVLDKMYLNAQSKVKAFMAEEKGDVNIVSMVVLIGVAVLLAIIFRESIETLITDMLNQISKNANNAINP